MKTFNFFVVELEKPINDTIKTESGLELFIETKFENSEFDYRVTEGPVVAAPFKYDTGVEIGDTLYFHHLVVMQGGQVLTGFDNHYIVNYSDQFAVQNQAIAYKSQKVDTYIPSLGGLFLSLSSKKTKYHLILSKSSTSKRSYPPRLALPLTQKSCMRLEPRRVTSWGSRRTEIIASPLMERSTTEQE